MRPKRILAMILAMVMVAVMMPVVGVNAATDGYYTYTVKNGEVTITRVDESISGDVVIPDTLGGYPVTVIGSGAFWYLENITSITLSESIHTIETYYTTNDGIHAFCDMPFYGCNNLKEFIVDPANEFFSTINGVLYSKDHSTIICYPYAPDSSLYTILDSVTSIGECAFFNSKKLETIIIPNSVTNIGAHAFAYCSSLSDVNIPTGITGDIKEYSFFRCTNLKSIIIPDGVTGINGRAFFGCEKLKSIILPNSIKLIEYCAFNSCTSLESITIPDGVVISGGSEFAWCTNLKNITIGDRVTGIGSDTFENTAYYNDYNNWKDGVLYIGNHLVEAQNTVSGEYELKEGTVSIGDYAFGGCNKLMSIIIPESVKSIGFSAFSNCEMLTNITIPAGITLIDYSVFYGCKSLTDIIIPDSVTGINGYAFEGCTNITSIIIPDSVTYIGYGAFSNCVNLTEIVIPNSVKNISDDAFEYCTKLTIYCPEYSSAHVYAIENDIPYVLICKNHLNTQVINQAIRTCISDGYTGDTYCNDCSIVFERGRYIPATGHQNTEIINSVIATCTTDGYTGDTYCADCETVIIHGEVIPATGHSIVNHEGKEVVFCTEIGWSDYKTCANCDYTTYIEFPVRDHTYIQHEAKIPTCTEIGWESYETCSECSYTTYIELPALGHTSGEWVTITEPTETTEGLRTKSCTGCGEEVEREVIPVIVPTHTPGDATGDEKINLSDVSLVLQYIAKWDVTLNTDAADVNADDIVNLSDVSLLLQYIAKWDVVLI